MKKNLLLLSLWVVALTGYSQSYQLNTQKSQMAWAGKAAFSTYTLGGAIQPKSGQLRWEGGGIRNATLLIDMQSISSEISQLEEHLRSADFFEVERFPEAGFVLSQPAFLEPGETAASGILTLKEVARAEKVPLKINREGKTVVVEGKMIIDRTAYGIYYNSPNFFENLKQDAIADEFELAFTLVFEAAEAK